MTHMNQLHAHIDGIGVLGPGLDDWQSGSAALAGRLAYAARKAVLPAPVMLPAAERRRCGPLVRVALAAGLQAAGSRDLSTLPMVFSASSGDGANCHEICQMLASSDRQISPTRFHNSVHNAPAGYWSIGAGAMETASVLCAHDASFGAGLLEAMAQVVADKVSVLLICADSAYPEPLHAARPIPGEFGLGLLLSPRRGMDSIAGISVGLSERDAARLADPELEALRSGIPAARSLPLLQALARGESAGITLDYLEHSRIALDLAAGAQA
jgi:Beta-ketoacyl synthase, N-terminal domain